MNTKSAQATDFGIHYVTPYKPNSDLLATGTTVLDSFPINGDNWQTVTYTVSFTHEAASKDEYAYTCSELTSSSYFTVTPNAFYLCFVEKVYRGVRVGDSFEKIYMKGSAVSSPSAYDVISGYHIPTEREIGEVKNVGSDGKLVAADPKQTTYLAQIASTTHSANFTFSGRPLFDGGTISTSSTHPGIQESDGGSGAPTIDLLGSTTLGRPEMLFQLKHVISKGGAATFEDNVMYFMYALSVKTDSYDEQYSNIGIKVNWDGKEAKAVDVGDIRNYKDDSDSSTTPGPANPHVGWANVDLTSTNLLKGTVMDNLINRVYNEKNTGSNTDGGNNIWDENTDGSNGDEKDCGKVVGPETGTPKSNWTSDDDIKAHCINIGKDGWLAKWGVTINFGSFTNTTEEQGTCGVKWSLSLNGIVASALAKVLCVILEMIAKTGEWLINTLGINTIINSYHQLPHSLAFMSALSPGHLFHFQTAHAADSTIKETLNQGNNWVTASWKVLLGLADVFLVVILLFLAIINILHIQYDTYTIKKTLPLLIVGIILANFSLFITKMLVDVTNVITATFLNGQDAGEMFRSLLYAAVPSSGHPSFVTVNNLGSILLAIFFGIFALIGFLILGFLFYLRYAVILALTVVAPLAFVFMAFPPTQGLFKLWWGWYSKFIFMKPVAIFLLWLAYQVLHGTCNQNWQGCDTGITQWAIATFLVYMAFYVPFKLGGVVSSVWGGIGKSVTGTGKGGYMRKPVDDYIDRRKRSAGAFIKSLPGIRNMVASGKADELETVAKEKLFETENELRARKRRGGRATNWEARSLESENDLKKLVNNQLTKYRTGENSLGLVTRLRMTGFRWEGGVPKIPTRKELAGRLADSEANLLLSEADLDKAKQDTFTRALVRVGRENNSLSAQLKEMLEKQGIALPNFLIDEDGNYVETEGKVTYGDYMNTASRLHEMAVTEKNAKKRANLEKSAAFLENTAAGFANDHPLTTPDGRNLYGAHMNARYAGRIYSVLTKLYMDEIQVNQLNETAETMLKRAKEGYGPRNIKGGTEDLRNFARLRYSAIGDDAGIAGAQELKTWMEDIGRRGNKDRGRQFANFVELFDDGQTFNPNYKDPGRAAETKDQFKGELTKHLLRKREEIKPGANAVGVAEALQDADERGTTLAGFEALQGQSKTIGLNGALLKEAAEAEGIDIVDAIAQHADFWRQLDLTVTARNTHKVAMMSDIADLAGEMENFCGVGNVVSYSIKTTDKPMDEWFSSLQPKAGSSPEAQASTEERHRREQAQEEAATTFAQTDPATMHDTSAAITHFSENVLPALATKIANFRNAFQLNGQSPTGEEVERLIDAISQAQSANIGDLVGELSQKLGVQVTASANVNLANEASGLVQDAKVVSQGNKNAQTLIDRQETAIAEDVWEHTPERAKNASAEDIQKSIDGLQEAAASLTQAMDALSKSTDPNAKLNEELLQGIIDKIGVEKPTVRLTAESLQDPFKLSDTLNKMVVGLKAIQSLKKTPGASLEQQEILKSIKTQLQQINQRLSKSGHMTEGAAPQSTAPPGPTPPPAGPTTPSGQPWPNDEEQL